MMMVAPIDAEKNETKYIAEKDRNHRTQRSQIRSVRRSQLQHHNGDDDGHHTIAERFHSPLTHFGLRLTRSEEHTSELQSLAYLVCRLLLEKKKKKHSLPCNVHIPTTHTVET